MLRRFRLLVFLLTFIPITSGAALLPIGFGLGIVTGITATSLILPVVAASVVVGAALSWITIGGTPSSEAQTAPLNVQIDPKAPLPTPAGWTPPVAPAIQPTPPSSRTADGGNTGSYDPVPAWIGNYNNWTPQQIYWNAGQERLEAVCSNGLPQTYPCPSGFDGSGLCSHNLISNCLRVIKSSPLSCPAGYTLSSGSCTLTNANIVQKPSDSRCFVIRNGNTYSADANDPDCQSGLPAEWVAGPNSITWGGKGNGDGGGAVVIDPGTGEVTITSSKQNTDGTTTTTTIKGSAPNSGAAPGAGVTVKGTSESTYKGTGSLQGSTAIGEIPNDYNRETTQQQILSKLGTGIKLDETGTPTDSALQSQKDALDAAADERLTAIQNLSGTSKVVDLGLGLSITWPSMDCTDPAYTLPHGMGELVIPMCSKQSDINSIMSWIVGIGSALMLFSIGVGALSGGKP